MSSLKLHGASVQISAAQAPTLSFLGLFSIIVVIVVADDADTNFLKENQAVLIPDFSDETLNKCGTQDTAKSVIKTLGSQAYKPTVYAIRVAKAATPAATATKVIAGLAVIENLAHTLGIDVSLIGAPGLEVNSATITKIKETAKSTDSFAHASLKPFCADFAAVETERAKHDDEHLELFWASDYPKLDGGNIYITALSLAIRALEDATQENGGVAKTISNIRINNGIDEITPIGYKQEDSLGNRLNKIHITTLIQKAPDDIRFWGNRTTSTNPSYLFETDTRISLWIKKRINEETNDIVDKITNVQQLKDLEQIIKVKVFVAAKNDGVIPGGDISFVFASNGDVTYSFDFGTFAPMEQLRFSGEINKAKYNEINSLPT